MSNIKKKIMFAAAKDPWSIPGDCVVFDTMRELKREAPDMLGIAAGSYMYTAKVEITDLEKFEMTSKTTTRLESRSFTQEEYNEG